MLLRKIISYLLAPLLLNIILFAVYLLIGPKILLPGTGADLPDRHFELLLIRLSAFAIPVSFSLIRTRLFHLSVSGHEIGLVVFSAWILGECADLLSLLNAGAIFQQVAVYRGLKISIFAVASLILTSLCVNALKNRLLGELVHFFQRSAVLLLLGLAYLSASMLVLVINYDLARQAAAFQISIAILAVLVAALNVHGYLVFRRFYRDAGQARGIDYESADTLRATPRAFQASIQSKLDEILSYADMLESRHADVAHIRGRIRRSAHEISRHFKALAGREDNRLHPSQKGNSAPHAEQRRILVVEGAEINRVILTEYLKSVCDCSVHSARNGREGIDAARSLYYDLIIVDIGLPDISGIDVSTAIREYGIASPIIAMAAGNEDLRADAMAAGVNVYLQKPVSREEVLLHLQEQI